MVSGSKAQGSGQNFKNVDSYLHAVSDVRNSSSGVRYFDFKLQERDEKRRVVCFSPHKRDEIKEKEKSKTPVRLINVSLQKRKFEPDVTEYKLTSKSKILVTKNLSFPWEDLPESGKKLTIREIHDNTDTGDIVSLKAKVVWKGEVETVYSRNMRKDLQKCELVLADDTGTIGATIWEEKIAMLSDQPSYLFSNLKVGFFKRKCLNGTKEIIVLKSDTDIWLPADSEEAANLLKPKEKETEDVIGRIAAVDVNKYCLCINCKSRVTPDDDECCDFIDCQSCKLRMLKENLLATASESLVIVSEKGENLGRFYCEGSVLNKMMVSVSQADNYNIAKTNVANLSRSMITDMLLLIKRVGFQVSTKDKLIMVMSVLCSEIYQYT